MTKLITAALLFGCALTAHAQWGTYTRPYQGYQYEPPVTSRPNVFGGYNIEQPGRPTITTRPNVFGGYNITQPGRPQATCRPNVFGGVTCQ